MSGAPATPTGMASRSGTLTPPSTATNGNHITRADYQRWAHEDRNHTAAETTRLEKEERKKFRLAEKERWRSQGVGIKSKQKEQLVAAKGEVEKHKTNNAAVGSQLRERADHLSKTRTEQQKKWADHGYELTQQYTIKAAQNNMRSLKAQNAGIVNSMHAKRQDHETIVEAQRQQAQEERRQRVEKIRNETTDNVTRAAKKAFVDERWDVADGQREQSELYRKMRKEQELHYLEHALALNSAISLEPAKQARQRSSEEKAVAAKALREKKQTLKEQAEKDATSGAGSKTAIHDSIHSLKFIPEEDVRLPARPRAPLRAGARARRSTRAPEHARARARSAPPSIHVLI